MKTTGSPTAGGESGHLAPHPDNPELVYGGSYGGYLQRYDHTTNESRVINVWPDNPMGAGAEGMKYRFQWNFPIFFSPHNANTLYTAGHTLFKSTNEGQTWIPISTDLTRADSSTLGPSGGPITKDNTGVEYYATIFAAEESIHEPGVIWAGSDDGLIHITRNNGQDWTNVTPNSRVMPEWILINSIEIDPFNPGGLYVAATMYKHGDFAPYLYRTKDYGSTWSKIVNGIEPDHFTRVIRADPDREGLLYAGTESGVYISFDDGDNWSPFQLNLPVVPITDMTLRDKDLIVATQGRSFWLIDDISPLHQLNEDIASSSMWLFNPRPTYRLRGGSSANQPKTAGKNPPNGVMIRYYLDDEPSDSTNTKIRILDEDGSIIHTFSSAEKADKVMTKAGMNQFVWDFNYPEAEGFDGLIMWAGNLSGPKAVPGMYSARLIVGEDSMTVPFEVLKDPRLSSTVADLQMKYDFVSEANETLTETHRAIKRIRSVREQINTVKNRLEDYEGSEQLQAMGDVMLEKMKEIEETLYQTKNQSRQDPLNFPIRLNNKLAAVKVTVQRGEFRPTDQQVAVKDELTKAITIELEKLQELLDSEIPSFNQMAKDLNVPAIYLEKGPKPAM